MSNSVRRNVTLIAAAAAIQLASLSGHADPASSNGPVLEEPTVTAQRNNDARTVRVDYSDLRIASAAGMETLRARIHGAVKAVCGDSADIRILRATKSQRDCRQEAWDHAMAQVDQAVGEVRVAAR
jgi:UrcA family protein